MACLPASMRVTPPNLSIPVAQMRPTSDLKSEQRQPSQVLQHHQAQERMNAKASVPSAAMSFAVNPNSNSVTVTLADRNSGEVLRQLVYKFGGLPRSASGASGKVIDVSA